MTITEHDRNLVEPMMRELMDMNFEIDGRTGDNLDHLRAIASEFLDGFASVLHNSVLYVVENAEEKADKRSADDAEHVTKALIASVPLSLSGTLIAMVVEKLLAKGLSGAAALQEGRVSEETASALIDEVLEDTISVARQKALRSVACASSKRQAKEEVDAALTRAANQSKK